MKRSGMELLMACLLLVCFYYLSREAAVTSKTLLPGRTAEAAETLEETTEGQSEVKTEEEPGEEQSEKASNGEASGEEKSERESSGEKSGEEDSIGKGTIVVDPGHGGMDPGMIGIDGLKEKGINLAISQKVKVLLEKDGYNVVLTRESDAGLYDENASNQKAQDMQRRITRITEEEPLLAVSIHQNSYGDSSVCGPQVFYYADSIEGERLAQCLQDSLNAIPGVARQREIKGNTSYYLLKRSPAVLTIVECGFLTNPDEAALLQNETYQELVAEAIEQGVLNYLENETTM